MSPLVLRKKLGLTTAQFARALGVHERTVARWNAGAAPDGASAEVLAGIQDAIDEGHPPAKIGKALTAGVRRLLYEHLIAR